MQVKPDALEMAPVLPYGEPAEAPEVYVEAYGEAAAGPDAVAEAPAFAAARPEVEILKKHHARAPPPVSPQRTTMTYPYRSLDVFRGEAVLVEEILPRADVVCPNAPEAEVLLGLAPGTVASPADAAAAATALRARLGCGAVLLKGGHLAGPRAADVWADATGTLWLAADRTPGLGAGGVWRTSVLKEMGFTEGMTAEDDDLSMRTIRAGMLAASHGQR